jgi:hypothetical protein
MQKLFFNILGKNYELTCFDQELANYLETTYKRFLKTSKPSSHLSISIFKRDDKPFISLGDNVSLLNRSHFKIHAFSIVSNFFLQNIASHFILHAGCVSADSFSLILYAPSSFGKSTLILKLIERGMKFLSDDFTPLNRKSGYTEPFPKAINLKEGSFPLLSMKHKKKLLKNTKYKFKDRILFDIEDLFQGSFSQSCLPTFIFSIRGEGSTMGLRKWYSFDIGLFEESEEFLKFLENKKEIRSVNLIDRSRFNVYRVLLHDYKTLHAVVQDIRHFNDDILFVEKLPEDKPDFQSSPEIAPHSKFDASLELMHEMMNLSAIREESEDVNDASILLEVFDLIKGCHCFSLKAGKLEDTADLIIETVRKRS